MDVYNEKWEYTLKHGNLPLLVSLLSRKGTCDLRAAKALTTFLRPTSRALQCFNGSIGPWKAWKRSRTEKPFWGKHYEKLAGLTSFESLCSSRIFTCISPSFGPTFWEEITLTSIPKANKLRLMLVASWNRMPSEPDFLTSAKVECYAVKNVESWTKRGQFSIPKKDQIIQTRQAKWLVQSLRGLQHWALATR